MPFTQRTFLLAASLCFLIFVLHLIKKKKLSAKHSLLWIGLSIIGIAAAALPGWVFWITELFEFGLPVNMLFFGCIFFLMAAMFLTLTTISDQANNIRELVQEISLLKHRVELLEQNVSLNPGNEREDEEAERTR